MLAPNDPHRIPVAHRELVNKLFDILKEKGYNIFESQVILQALSTLARTSDLPKGLDALTTIIKAVNEVVDAHRDIEAILQILGLKMTESLNDMKLGSVEFKELSLED